MVGGRIEFEVGQTHDTVYSLRALLKDYAIQKAQRLGFIEGCKPFIGIDGCHLKGPYRGVHLMTVALDANNGLFSIAFCISEGEILSSWTWFLKMLREYLKYTEDRPISFMSDRQNGVIGALKSEWPTASIRAYDMYVFKRVMTDICTVSADAKAWLEEIELKHYSRHAFDPNMKCDNVTNNITEAFNSLLGDYRVRAYLSLLEYIRRLVMTRFQQRKEDCQRWKTEFPPSVNKKIVQASLDSRILTMIHAGEREYEMLGLTRISGVPCNHALTGIRHFYGMGVAKERLIDFVHPSLSKSAFVVTYRNMIHPIPNICAWVDVEVTHVDPSPLIKKSGRPETSKEERIK
ncbi:hypothetical protein Ddye_004966 [Dipteronia dyeriana]|uniref:MULE transposase domain-containing protein n=1 Tax=Dipteronia dyeriana TaxID=168575 RepID=A0AAD9XG68_9ROSI|nr:hypothetical protein Ddye_004966 [Dipteronia dyeriana]